MSLYQRLQVHAEQQPDKTAIDSAAGELSYHQLKVLTDWCIEYFESQGIAAGDRVALLALNHPDWFIATFAAAQCGVVLVPLNWRLSTAELRFVIEDSQPKLLLHDSEFMQVAVDLQKSATDLQVAIFCNSDFPARGSVTFKPTASSTASHTTSNTTSYDNTEAALFIVYTSGTTGRPKGAVLSQKAVLCSAQMSRHMTDMTPHDNVLNVLPLFHIGGLNIQPLPALIYGATLVLHARFIPDEAVDALSDKNITLVNSVPTLLQAMLDSPGWQPQKYHALRAISIGSTDVPLSLINRVQDASIALIQVYGATETGPVAIYQCIEDADIVGTIGKAGACCEIKICNKDGVQVAPGESGEILVKGGNILSHYWRNEKATSNSIKEGWFRTGDVAHVDSDGYYWFDDRLKHVVISGGENIYPAELERVIREVPGVGEVAVVGRHDERWGEVPVAVISGNATPASIHSACEVLARFKRPKDVVFVDSLPRNALGKVQVHQVKKLLENTGVSTCESQ